MTAADRATALSRGRLDIGGRVEGDIGGPVGGARTRVGGRARACASALLAGKVVLCLEMQCCV
jgi:hypothetical protein